MAALAAPHSREKVMLSTAYQAAFRQALATGLADGSFPSQYNTAQLWDISSFPLATPSVDLGSGVFLHLTDGRTHRTGKWGVSYADRTILGAAQRQAVGQVYAHSPADSIHLFASGSVMGEYCKSYPSDWDWMLATTGVRRTLALSGDIHRNAQDEFAGTQFPLYEATSSGAGVKELVVFGNDCQNYGVVELDASHVNIQLYAHNTLEPQLRRRIVRSSWAQG